MKIIHAHFIDRYKPVFRRGAVVHCANGDEINYALACVPDSVVIKNLADAVDAPRDDHGVRSDKLPGFFKKWAPVAWGDLRAELPDEIHAATGDDAPARETFVRLVREALCTQVTFGDVIAKHDVTQRERRSVIKWCLKLAKLGPWRDIRVACWCKLVELDGGEFMLKVAIRHELFAQISADKWLSKMGAPMFSRLVAKYGIGRSCERDRPHGRRAVVFEDEFIRDLTAGIADDEDLPMANGHDDGDVLPARKMEGATA